MIAHLDNGKSTEIRPGGSTLGLRVVRWEFDFYDMCELLNNPELLPVLATRMPPPQREWQGLTDEERNDCLVEADPCEALLNHEAWELMRTIEAKLKEKNT